jgi:hypothetical protein
MDGLCDLTMPPSSFGLTSFGDPIVPSFGGLYADDTSTSTIAPPMAASGSAYQFSHLITVKLGKDNFLLWRAQIFPRLRSQGLLGFVDSSYLCPPAQVLVSMEGGHMVLVQNPEHHAWVKQDQAILSTIIDSLTPSVSGLVLFAMSSLDA